MQDEVERSATCQTKSNKGERLSASAREQSRTRADKNDQRDEEIIDDVPEGPLEPPLPPNKTV